MSALLHQLRQDSPGLLWMLDEASGSAVDYSGNGFSGAYDAGIARRNASLFGTPVAAWDTDNEMVASATTTNAAVNPTNALTLLSFYKDDAWGLGVERPLIHKPFTSHTAPFYQYTMNLYRTAGGVYQPYFYVTVGGTLRDTSAIVPTLAGYAIGAHMLAVTWSGVTGLVQFFLDGAPVAAAAAIPGGVGTNNTYLSSVISGRYGNVAQGWRGLLGPAAVYTSVLPAARIAAIWQAALRYGVVIG